MSYSGSLMCALLKILICKEQKLTQTSSQKYVSSRTTAQLALRLSKYQSFSSQQSSSLWFPPASASSCSVSQPASLFFLHLHMAPYSHNLWVLTRNFKSKCHLISHIFIIQKDSVWFWGHPMDWRPSGSNQPGEP